MSNRLRTASGAGGFTLVEVMVALLIMSILAVMAWQGVDGIVRTRTASQARLEQTLRLNTVLGQLEQDLQSLQDTPTVPPLRFDGATLRFTRRADNGIQVVTWSLRPKVDATGNVWLRWAGPPARTNGELQETWMRTQQFQGSEPGQLPTLAGITQWQVYCFRRNAWTNCQSSDDVVVTQTSTGPPPTAGGNGAGTGAATPGTAASAPGTGTGTAGTGTSGGAAGTAATPVVRYVLPTGVRVVLQFDSTELSGTLTRDIALAP